jgi:hypothetical protein
MIAAEKIHRSISTEKFDNNTWYVAVSGVYYIRRPVGTI